MRSIRATAWHNLPTAVRTLSTGRTYCYVEYSQYSAYTVIGAYVYELQANGKELEAETRALNQAHRAL